VLASLAPARRRLLLGLLAAVVVAGVAAVVVALASGGSTRRAVAQNQPGPVLLVPGYGGSTSSLSSLAGALRNGGKDVTIVSLPGDGTGDLRAQAQTLGRAATAALARTQAASVDVVGYSAGGVVARLWVRDYGGAAVARRVVTLGSPQHGTRLAELGALLPAACPTACQQLAPDSDLLASLNRGDETPAGPQFFSVWTTGDDVVTPPDSARLTGAVNLTVQSICAGADVSHGDLPRDRLVQAIVAADLVAGAPVSPTAADC
jgi:triacylglycerol esterase/lipase EstA (alpha/beta hydrolase family)